MKQISTQLLVAVVLAGFGILFQVINTAEANDDQMASINATCKTGADCPDALECIEDKESNKKTCQSLCLIYPDDYIWTATRSHCVFRAGKGPCKVADQCTENAVCVTGIPRAEKSKSNEGRRKKREIVVSGRRYYYRPYRPVYVYRPRPIYYGSYYHRPLYYHHGYYHNYRPVPLYTSGSSESASQPKEDPTGDCNCRFGPRLGLPDGTCPNIASGRSLSITSLIFCGILQIIITFSYLF